MTGSPAASALVHPAARRALDVRSNTAPEPAVGLPPFHRASYSSYRVHVSLLTMIACRSDPPSTWVSDPNGYGPGSLSSAYVKLTGTSGCASSTTSKGIPYDGGPKSGCRNVRVECIARFHTSECGFTGSFDTFRCQTLPAGKISHAVPSTGTAGTGLMVAAPISVATTSTIAVRVPRTSQSSAAEQATVEPDMAHAPAERTGFLQRPSTGLLGGLVAIHLLV